jgi:flagellar biosynthesis chaperone FliJ
MALKKHFTPENLQQIKELSQFCEEDASLHTSMGAEQIDTAINKLTASIAHLHAIRNNLSESLNNCIQEQEYLLNALIAKR